VTSTSTYASNLVTITNNVGLSSVDNDDETGRRTFLVSQIFHGVTNILATLRNYAENSKIYNINVANTHGKGEQALALSAYANNQGYYGCQFTGYQGL